MSVHTTDAIVLRRYPFRETSVTLTCLTDGYGKLKGLIKGLRITPNRYRSAMEPLTVNRIVFYDTRTSQLHLISQCELLAPLTGIQRDLETMKLAARFVELIDHLIPLEEPQPLTYQLLRETLERLALGGVHPDALHIHFIARLLRLAGFQPRLDECTSCNSQSLAQGYWSARQGGLLCARCLHEDPQADPAPAEMLQTFAALSETSQPLSLDLALTQMLRQRLEQFLQWRVDRHLTGLHR